MKLDPEKVYYIGKEIAVGEGVWDIQGIFFDSELGKENMKDGEFMVEITPNVRLLDISHTPDVYWWKFNGKVEKYDDRK